jgi:predicted metal-dependent enzyme (double-stranded beta helix superfamily)
MADQFVLDNPTLREFIANVRRIQSEHADPRETVAAIRPHFETLLNDTTWLPMQYQESAPESGMGAGIGTWLLYRETGGALAFSALVVPPNVQTPVHDHLAWGLVGLYRGTQDEEVFTRHDADVGQDHDRAILELTECHSLKPGDFYELLPENDIHRVRTTSDVTSVSLHLLGNDNGCIWRHRFHPEEGRVEPFRSGYVNVDCATETEDIAS